MFSQTVCVLIIASTAAALGGPGVSHQPTRPKVGVAFGGGSARGLAHVGVIRWFEEHRIPIDRVSGTSMGGLVGGAFASGMNAAELHQLLAETDWDAMFGASSFRYKNIRRKDDARDYPSRIEFGLKRGIVPPPSLNNGQQVEFLLSRIAGAYGDLQSFDELPTPFRCMAVDLKSSTPVVLDKGSLPRAMRATMSLPLIFPPVDWEGRVLVDGGAMNNVPADVARADGRRRRRRRQRRRDRRARHREPDALRRRGRDARFDDARVDAARDGVGRFRSSRRCSRDSGRSTGDGAPSSRRPDTRRPRR